MTESAYAGDKTPQETWDMLANQPGAMLVDVRSSAEWAFVGVVDLSDVDKEVILVAWQEFPEMAVNSSFVDQVREEAPDPTAPLLFICRSGVRSQSTAAAMTAAGYTSCFNVLEGFEGDLNDSLQRSTTGGWKFHGLPWEQY